MIDWRALRIFIEMFGSGMIFLYIIINKSNGIEVHGLWYILSPLLLLMAGYEAGYGEAKERVKMDNWLDIDDKYLRYHKKISEVIKENENND